MTVSVRPATPADAGALAALAAVTFPLACPPHVTAQAKAAFIAAELSEGRFAEYLADRDRRLLVAVDAEGHAVGYTMLKLGEAGDEDVRAALRSHPAVELSKCYVLPDHHGAGVAGRLMAESLRVAAETGAAAMWLGVHEQNVRAQRFYARQGFERVGVKHAMVDEAGGDDWVMERQLG